MRGTTGYDHVIGSWCTISDENENCGGNDDDEEERKYIAALQMKSQECDLLGFQ